MDVDEIGMLGAVIWMDFVLTFGFVECLTLGGGETFTNCF